MDKNQLKELLKELLKDGTIQIIQIRKGNQTELLISVDGELIEQEYS